MFPAIYYGISSTILLLLLYFYHSISNQKGTGSSKRGDHLFLILSLLLLAFMRFPSLVYNVELNPDESQTLTQALTLVEDPVYGRSVDGTTLGPMNSYALLVLHVFGLPIDYILARLTGLLLVIGSLYFFYRSLQKMTSPVVSRTSLLLVLSFFAATTNDDFVHYSSELTSLLIITSCFFLALKILQSPAVTIGPLVGLSALAGVVVYCKLQSIPIVGMLLLTVALYVIRTYQWKSIRYLVALGIGFLLPSIVVFGLAFLFHVERYFVDYYFVANLTTYSQLYADTPMNQQSFFNKVLYFFLSQKQPFDFLFFIGFISLIALAVAIGIVLNRFQQYKQKSFSWETFLVFMILAGALFAVIEPGTGLPHHLLLLVFPLGWLTGLSLQQLVDNIPAQRIRAFTMAVCGVVVTGFLSLNTVVQVYGRPLYHQLRNQEVAADTLKNSDRNPGVFTFPNHISLAKSPVAQRISRYVKQSDKMAVWGWNCRFYVENQLGQGVSEGHTQRCISPNEMQHLYLRRYANELLTNRPAVFVDAVGKASLKFTKPTYRHEYFAEVNQVIQKEYTLVDSLDDVRIYVRQDQVLARRMP